ncbi:SRPBCC family protein [Actinoplanes sp. TBRC 11911]|uniref:SRPBCC family protein n=1 Tax=Actinoplanes sp. TBRC 11911 TaxID=2729386 RepID=UPI00145EA183|nr:SRPBCC family protein [Actinoplanes sp. TBRC 11911]NMO51846.1 SRPBCC family protein [Actinoplanes sp. TBRC 11911]
MPTDRFSHSFVVDALPSRVYAHLIEPQSYVGLSPLVVTVREVEQVADAVRYVAVERFGFGPFRWDNNIRVEMRGTPDVRVVSDVSSPGRVRLVATVDLRPARHGTQVTEIIELTAPILLRGFANGQARKVQQERAAELTRRMRA